MANHLLSVGDLGRAGITRVLDLAERFAEVSERPVPKVPTLRGKTVATIFFEASTRTRLSFETAAKRLSADTMTFSVASSSMEKGESLRDTVETIDAMGVDAMVIRHGAPGVPRRVTEWVGSSVLNAGDGEHEHPTQALLDCYTMREAFAKLGREDFSGLQVSIVGDVRHSRVARSDVLALSLLGASVTLVGPSTLMPPGVEHWPVAAVSHSLDEVLGSTDVCYTLRLQAERMQGAFLPSVREYRERFGLTVARAQALPPHALVLHPGPMNRGVEIDDEVAAQPNALVTRQVRNGVAVRMAVLYLLIAAPQAADDPLGPEDSLLDPGGVRG